MRLRKGKARSFAVFAVGKGGDLELWDSFNTEREARAAWAELYKGTSDGARFVVCSAEFTRLDFDDAGSGG